MQPQFFIFLHKNKKIIQPELNIGAAVSVQI